MDASDMRKSRHDSNHLISIKRRRRAGGMLFCGCCGGWVKHMQANGFRVETHDVADVTPIKQRNGVPDSLASCHTALVGGYALEGHVPAADVWRLLRERPALRGLAVPGMVAGSPGMGQGAPQRYATIAFDERGSRIFAQH